MSQSPPLTFRCDVCGKTIYKGWFGIGDTRVKCGACCKPPRRESFPVFPDHDPGDEDRS